MWRFNIHTPNHWFCGIWRGQVVVEEIQKEELETIQFGFLLFSIEIFWNKEKEACGTGC